MHELQGLQPRLRVEVGDAFDAIIRVADAEEADLVVMGEHRKRLLRDVFVGTTIERVMRLGNRPVLMVNGPAERPYRRILAAVDASEPAAHALRTAHRLGFLARAELTAFHAFELLPGRGVMMRADVSDEAIQEHVRETAAERRAELEDFLRGIDLGVGSRLPRLVLEEGPPARRCVKSWRGCLLTWWWSGHAAAGRSAGFCSAAWQRKRCARWTATCSPFHQRRSRHYDNSLGASHCGFGPSQMRPQKACPADREQRRCYRCRATHRRLSRRAPGTMMSTLAVTPRVMFGRSQETSASSRWPTGRAGMPHSSAGASAGRP